MKTCLAFAFCAIVLLAGCSKPRAYPLTTCVVCGQSLVENGAPVVFVYENQEVRTCSQEHATEFKNDTPKYMKKIMESKVL